MESILKTLTLAIFTLSLLFNSAAEATEQNNEKHAAARAAAETWLKLVDAGDYSSAWATSSSDIKRDTSQFFWTSVVKAGRIALGSRKSHTLKATVPDHENRYVKFEYDSVFSKDQNVSESVTIRRENDGAWRVAGYNVDSR